MTTITQMPQRVGDESNKGTTSYIVKLPGKVTGTIGKQCSTDRGRKLTKHDEGTRPNYDAGSPTTTNIRKRRKTNYNNDQRHTHGFARGQLRNDAHLLSTPPATTTTKGNDEVGQRTDYGPHRRALYNAGMQENKWTIP